MGPSALLFLVCGVLAALPAIISGDGHAIVLGADPNLKVHVLSDLDMTTGFLQALGPQLFDFDDEVGSSCDFTNGVLWSVTTLSDGGSTTQYLRQYSLSTGAQVSTQIALNNSVQDMAFSVDVLHSVNGKLYGVVYEGMMGWIHGVFLIDTTTGGMKQVASFQPPELTWDADLWVNGAVDYETETLYLFFATVDASFLVGVNLQSGNVSKVALPPGNSRLLAQPVYYNGMLFGWVGQKNAQLVTMDVITGTSRIIAGVSLPGYIAGESVQFASAAKGASTIRVSGSLDGEKKGAYVATVDIGKQPPVVAAFLNVSQPMWFLCPR